MRSWVPITVLSLIVGIPWAGWQLFAYRHHLSLVPGEMGVWRVLDVSEESWGFGPGGNETGLLTYALPDETRRRIEVEGVRYFEALPNRGGRDWRGRYEHWSQTPIDIGEQWGSSSDEGIKGWVSPGIGDYLDRYGFGIRIDPKIERSVNEALFSPGSFYAYGRIGIIIVAPAQGRVYYAYNG